MNYQTFLQNCEQRYIFETCNLLIQDQQIQQSNPGKYVFNYIFHLIFFVVGLINVFVRIYLTGFVGLKSAFSF